MRQEWKDEILKILDQRIPELLPEFERHSDLTSFGEANITVFRKKLEESNRYIFFAFTTPDRGQLSLEGAWSDSPNYPFEAVPGMTKEEVLSSPRGRITSGEVIPNANFGHRWWIVSKSRITEVMEDALESLVTYMEPCLMDRDFLVEHKSYP